MPEGGDLRIRQETYFWINHYRQPEFEAELASSGWSITDRALVTEQPHHRHMIFWAA